MHAPLSNVRPKGTIGQHRAVAIRAFRGISAGRSGVTALLLVCYLPSGSWSSSLMLQELVGGGVVRMANDAEVVVVDDVDDITVRDGHPFPACGVQKIRWPAGWFSNSSNTTRADT